MISINNTVLNLKLANALLKNIKAFSTTMQRMATGLRINSPADDPAGFYLSSKLGTQISGLNTANTNIQNALSILGKADESLGSISKVLDQMRKLISESCDEYLTPKEREQKQAQINALFAEVLKTKENAEVDGKEVFGGSVKLDRDKTYTDGHVTVAAGYTLNRLGDRPATQTQPQPETQPEAETETQAQAATQGNEGVEVAAVMDEEIAAYNPEDEEANAIAAYDAGITNAAVTNEATAVSETTTEPSTPESLNQGIAMASAPMMMRSMAPAAYSGETVGEETPTEYVTGPDVALDGISEEENAALQAIAAQDGNAAVATAAEEPTIIDWENCADLGTEGSYEVAAASSSVVQINGMKYLIENNDETTAQTLTYSTDENNRITFNSDGTTPISITAAEGQEDNIILNGSNITLNTNDENDNILNNGTNNVIDGGEGTDELCAPTNASASTSNIENVSIDWSYYTDLGANAGSVNIDAGTSKIIKIADKLYHLENTGSESIAMDIKLKENGKLAFTTTNANSITITAANGQVDNVLLDGQGITFHAGDRNDAISVNDGKKVAGIYAGDGNDTIHVYGDVTGSVDAGEGADTIYKGAYTDIGSTLNIETTTSYAASGTVSGITAQDSYEQSKFFIINGKKYGARLSGAGGNPTGTLNWSINEAGQITFKTTFSHTYSSQETIMYLIAENGQEDNVSVNGASLIFYAQDMDDTIIVKSGVTVDWVEGGDGNDYIENNGTIQRSFTGNAGDDTIINKGNTIEIVGSDGNDYIENRGTVNANDFNGVEGNDGDDTIINYGTITGSGYSSYPNNWLTGDAGNDIIYNYGSTKTITGGDGNDTIYNNGVVNNLIYGGESSTGSDNGWSDLLQLGANSSIGGYNISKTQTAINNSKITGFESIIDKDENVIVTPSQAPSTITVSTNKATYRIGNNFYCIYTSSGEATLNWSKDANGVITFTSNSNSTNTITISAKDGQNDNIILGGTNGINFYGKAGNDTIRIMNNAVVGKITSGDEFTDITNGDGSLDKLYIGKNCTIDQLSNSDITSNFENGVITFWGFEEIYDANGTLMQGNTNRTSGTIKVTASPQVLQIGDNIYSTYMNTTKTNGILNWSIDANGIITFQSDCTDKMTITAQDIIGQTDNVVINGAKISFYAGDMDDTITVKSGGSAYIVSAQEGDDIVINEGTINNYAYGGEGNDTITNTGTSSYISANDGNDSIVNNGTVSNYIYGGNGNDTIINNKTVKNISCNADNDSLINNGTVSNNIYGHDGDDTIINKGVVTNIIYGGNDKFETSINDTLYFGANSSVGGYAVTAYNTALTNSKITGIENFVIDVGQANSSISIAAGETIEMIINGNHYIVENTSTTQANVLKYSTNTTTGQITLSSTTTTAINDTFNITALDGQNDNISFGIKYGTLITGDENDTVSVTASYGIISTGEGDDSVTTTVGGRYSTIELGAGNDSLTNAAANASINAGDDDNYVKNTAASVGITTGSGADSIENTGASLTLNSGAGNDTISNTGAYGVYDAGEGDDSVTASGRYTTIGLGAGNDTLVNSGYQGAVNGGDGDDIYDENYTGTGAKNTVSNVEILDLGTGGNWTFAAGTTQKVKINDLIYTIENDDTVAQKLTYSTASGVITMTGTNLNVTSEGEQADNINFTIKKGTLDTGAGNDTIKVSTTAGIIAGDGDDSITTVAAAGTSTIALGAGADSITNVAYRAVIDGGDGDNYINNTASSVGITTGNGADSIVNTGATLTLNSGAGNDTISNTGAYGVYDAGEGDDSVTNSGRYTTIGLGAGNDTLVNSGYQGAVDGGDGDDIYDENYVSTGVKNTVSNVEYLDYGTTASSIAIAAGSSQGLIINGQTYIVENTSTTDSNTLNFSTNTTTGEITFSSTTTTSRQDTFKITAADGQTDKINFNVNFGTLNTGDGNDTVTSASSYGIINTGANDDTVTLAAGAFGSSVALGAGNDSMTNNAQDAYLVGGEGTDELDNLGTATTQGFEQRLDYDRLEWTDLGNDGWVELASGESKNVIIGGKKYVLYNSASAERTFAAKYDSTTGQITMTGSYINVTAVDGQVDNIDYKVYHGDLNTGDMNDSIINSAQYTTIGLGAGDDTVINNVKYVTISGDDGADSVTLNAHQDTTNIAKDSQDTIIGSTDDVNYIGTSFKTMSFAASESKTLLINGNTYTITNNTTNARTLRYNIAEDGAIIFKNNPYFSIVAAEGQEDNIVIDNSTYWNLDFSNFHITTGDMDDKIVLKNNAGGYIVNAGSGNDTIINDSKNTNIINCGEDADTIINNSSSTAGVFVIQSSEDAVIDNADSDYLGLISEFNKITISAGASNTITVGDKKYTLKSNTQNVAIDVLYGYNNETGQIVFYEGDSYLNITAASGQNDNIKLLKQNYSFNSINTGDGDDIVDANAYSISLGAGNDTVIQQQEDVFYLSRIDGGADDNVYYSNDAVIKKSGTSDTVYGNAALADSLSSISMGANTTKTITVGDKTYTVTNTSTSTYDEPQILYYGVNSETREAVFYSDWGHDLEIKAADGQNDNVHFAVLGGTFYAGDQDDTITVHYRETILAGGGDDSVTVLNKGNVLLGEGNDTVNIYSSSISLSSIVSGDAGSDTFIVEHEGLSDTTIMMDDEDTPLSTNSTVGMVINKSNSITIAAGATETITIDGYTYTVKNTSTKYSSSLFYGIDQETGKIYFKQVTGWNSYGYLVITAADGQDDKILLAVSNCTLNTGDGNDDVLSESEGNFDLGSGNDTFYSDGGSLDEFKIDGGDGDDSITILDGYQSSVSLGAGNDTLRLDTLRDKVDAGEGNDYIVNTANYSTFALGAGNDTLVNSGSGISVDGGEGVDYLSNSSTVTNNTNNEISLDESGWQNLGTDGVWELTAGESYTAKINNNIYILENTGSSTQLVTFETDQTTGEITFYGTDIKVTAAGEQGDNINFKVVNGTLNTGLGNDTIKNYGANSTVEGSFGDDVITNYGTSANINAGAGNDTVTNTGENAHSGSADGGDGLDIYYEQYTGANTLNTITNFETVYDSEGDKIADIIDLKEVNSGTFTLDIKGKKYDVEINAVTDDTKYLTWSYDQSTGQITFDSEAKLTITAHCNQEDDLIISGQHLIIYTGDKNDKVTINADEYIFSAYTGDDDDTIINNGTAIQYLYGGAGNDEIFNGGVVGWHIAGEDGNDTIISDYGGTVGTIFGGAGDDSISNRGEVTSEIQGNDGADVIVNGLHGSIVNVSGGAGNDSITNEEGAFVGSIYGDDGDDLIINNGEVQLDDSTSGIYGNAGDDTIFNNGAIKGSGVIIDGGAHTDGDTLYVGANSSIGSYNANQVSNAQSSGAITNIENIRQTSGSFNVTTTSQVLEINGFKYDVKVSSGTGTLNWEFDENGQITFQSDYSSGYMTITAHSGQKDNVNINGVRITFNAGDEDDTVAVKNAYSLSVGDGSDVIKLEENFSWTNFSDTDGSIEEIHLSRNSSISGLTYEEIINNYDNGVCAIGGSAGIVFNENIKVYDADGNLLQANTSRTSGTVTVDANRLTQLLQIGDKKYHILSCTGKQTLNWELAEDGTITFTCNGSLDGVYIVSAEGQSNKVILNGKMGGFSGAELDDYIVSNIYGNWISGGAGNDTIINNGVNTEGGIRGDVGNDLIINNGWVDADDIIDGIIDGGDDNDTLYVGANSSIGSYNASQISAAQSAGAITNIENIVQTSGSFNVTTTSKVLEINGFKYDVKVSSGTGTLNWEFDEHGQITFQSNYSSGTMTITAHSGQKDNVNINGARIAFNAGDEDDTITIQNALNIYGDAGNDSIVNEGTVATYIFGNADNDTIINNGKVANYINGDAGNDFITNNGNVIMCINGNDGADSIFNAANASVGSYISGAAGDDFITNEGVVTTYITGLEGDDSIINYGKVEGSIGGGDANDTLYFGANSSVGGYGSDNVIGAVDNSKITGVENIQVENGDSYFFIGAGATQTLEITIDDKVYKYDVQNKDTSNSATLTYSINEGQIEFDNSNNLTITAHENQADNVILKGTGNMVFNSGDLDDTINVYGSSVSFNTGDGTDSIIIHEDARVYGSSTGAGNDTVINNGKISEYIYLDDGDDVFNNYGYVGTIYGEDGADTITNYGTGEIYLASLGAGNDSITNEGKFSHIYGGFDNDTIINISNNSSQEIYGDEGDDSIVNRGEADHIYGNEGNDTIINNEGAWASAGIIGGDGNDSIVNKGGIGGYSSSISGGEGNDTIINEGTLNYEISGGSHLADGGDVLHIGASSSIGGSLVNDAASLESAMNSNKVTGIETVYDSEGNKIYPFRQTSGSVDLTGTSYSNQALIEIELSDGRIYKYDVYGDYSTDTLNWSIDENDQITFQTDSSKRIYISAHDGQNDNIILDGTGIDFNAGNQDDTIIITKADTIYAGDGNDSIINNSVNTLWAIHGDAGNDTIENSGSVGVGIGGGAGDDLIINQNIGFTSYITGGDGTDAIKNFGSIGSDGIFGGIYDSINGVGEDNSTNDSLYLGASSSIGGSLVNDKTTLENALKADKIQGIEHFYDSTSNVITPELRPTDEDGNVIDEEGNIIGGPDSEGGASEEGGSGTETITIGAGKTVTVKTVTVKIDGKYYDVKNNETGESTTLTYTLSSGQITFESSDDLTITAHESQEDNVLINGQSIIFDANDLDDTIVIEAYGYASYLFGGSGNDSIVNEGEVGNISGGDNNDTIINAANASVGSIWGNIGDDSIVNEGKVEWDISGGDGADTITNAANASVRIVYGDAGNDSIVNEGEVGNISGGDNNDTIINTTNASVGRVYGDAGNDSIVNEGNVQRGISGEDGADTITNATNASVGEIINGNAGDDSIVNEGSAEGLHGGDDADVIINAQDAYVSSIAGGAGNDTITNYGEVGGDYGISAGAGDDILYNYGVISSTIGLDAGDDSVWNYGEAGDFLGGDGNDSIVNEGEVEYYIYGGDGADTITNAANASVGYSISGDEGDDSIVNEGEADGLVGGAHSDIIINAQDAYVSSIAGGAGNDSIVNEGYVEWDIYGGDGADIIINAQDAYVSSIAGGAGNDTITNYGEVGSGGISGDAGDDSIVNEGIVSGVIYGGAHLVDGGDYLFVGANSSVGGYGANGVNDAIDANKIQGIENIEVEGGAKTITIGAGETKTIEIEMPDGSIYKYDVTNRDTGASTIFTYGLIGGQIEFNSETGKLDITAHDNQNDKILVDGQHIKLYTGDLNDTISIQNAYSVDSGAGNDSITNAGEIDYIYGAEGDDTITNLANASAGYINGNAGNDSIKNAGNVDYIYGGDDNDTVTNLNIVDHIHGDKGDDSIINEGSVTEFIYGEAGNDTIVNKANASVGNSIYGYAGNDVIKNEGKVVTDIFGGDGDDIITNSANASVGDSIYGNSGNDSIINKGSITNNIEGGADNDTITNTTNATIGNSLNGDAGEDIIKNEGNVGCHIYGGADNDTILNTANASVGIINSGAGNDSIVNSGAVGYHINGEDGDDSIQNNGNVTHKIFGEAGNDSIINKGTVNEILAGAGSDTILNSANASIGNIFGEEDDDSIVNKGFIIENINGGDGADTMINEANASVKYIYGNAGDDSILNKSGIEFSIYGGDGADTITIETNAIIGAAVYGDAGDDSIVNKGNVLYHLEGGEDNDTITNIANASTGYITGNAGDDSIVNEGTVHYDIIGGAHLVDGGDYLFVGANSSVGGYGANGVNDALDANKIQGIENIEVEGGQKTITIGADETKTIEIELPDGSIYKYDVTNRDRGTSTTLTYGIVDGQIEFNSETGKLDITAHDNQNDNILVDGQHISLDTGNYDDTITIQNADNIDAGAGDDSITNAANAYVGWDINGGAGDDSIINEGKVYGYIYGGADNDTIINAANASVGVIFGEAGNDSIVNEGEVEYDIYGGDGADTITNAANAYIGSSIGGEAGDDSIVNEGEVWGINGGDGADTITNAANASVGWDINGGAGDDSIVNEGYVDFIRGRNGNDTIINAANASVGSLIEGDADDDSIVNEGKINSYIYGGDGADTITNAQDAYVSSIAGGAGNDLIVNAGYVSNYIDGGDDADTITNAAKAYIGSSIGGGAGDDSIVNNGIVSGAIIGGAHLVDGGDYLFVGANSSVGGYGANGVDDALDANKIQGIENIEVEGGAKTITIGAGETKTIEIEMPDGSIYKYDVTNRDTGASTTLTYGIVDGQIEFNSETGALDITAHENQNDNILVDGQNINLNTGNYDDTITIQSAYSVDSGAGNDSIVNIINASVGSIYAGDGDDSILNEGSVRSTISGGNGNNTIKNAANASVFEVYAGNIINGNGDNLIENEGSISYLYGSSGNDTIVNKENAFMAYISGGNGDDLLVNDGRVGVHIWTGRGNDSIVNNGVVNGAIWAGDGADTITNATNASVGWDINGDAGDDSIVNEGYVDDNIKGGDDADTITNTANASVDYIFGEAGDDSIVNEGYVENDISGSDGADTITNAANASVGGTIIGDEGDDSIVNEGVVGYHIYGGADNDSITNAANASVGGISGEAGDDSIVNEGYIDTIVGGDDNDTITNAANASVGWIYGEAGNDSIVNEGIVSGAIVGGAHLVDGGDYLFVGANSSVGGYGANGVNDALDANKIQGIENIEVEGGQKTITIGAEETKTIEIEMTDGSVYKYDVRNINRDTSTTLTYGIVDGQIEFTSENGWLEITAHDNQNDNILVDGQHIRLYTGDLNDTITIQNADEVDAGAGDDSIVNEGEVGGINGADGDDTILNAANAYIIYGGEGNDSIVNKGEVSEAIIGMVTLLNNEEGNDTIINAANASVRYIYGGAGDDSIVNEGKVTNLIHGGTFFQPNGDGNDTIINAANASVGDINGEAGDDSIENNGTVTDILGGDGDDTVKNNGIITGTYYGGDTSTDTSVDDYLYIGEGSSYDDTNGVEHIIGLSSNSTIKIDAQETITIEIDGKKYDVKNLATGESATLTCKLDDSHQIEFSSEDGWLAITAHDGQNDNVSLNGEMISFNSGDKEDSIIINNAIWVKAGDGNDSIIHKDGANTSQIDGGNGNDMITIEGNVEKVFGDIRSDDTSNGDDTIIITNTASVSMEIDGGNGNDLIKNEGTVESITADAGDDEIYNYGTAYTIKGNEGKDIIYNYGSANGGVYGGSDDDKIYIYSDSNNVYGDDGNDMIFIYSDENEVDGGNGNDVFTIVGDNNFATGGGSNSDYDKIATNGKNNSYTQMNELMNQTKTFNIQTDWQIDPDNQFMMNFNAFLPQMEFDISSADRAKESLKQLDEIIQGILNARSDIGTQNSILESQMDYNLNRIENLKGSQSAIRDADVAEEYNKLIQQASVIEQLQLIQAQMTTSHYEMIARLISSVAG